MRTLNKNKVELWYSLYEKSQVIYKLDADGNRIVSYVDDSVTPSKVYYEEEGYTQDGYTVPQKFFGNITYSGGDAYVQEYGVSTVDYEAIVTVANNLIPIDETSLIWTHEPITGKSAKEDADYRVIKVHNSLNQSKYILAKVQK